MKQLKTTFIDSESAGPVGTPIEGVLVPVFVGMTYENEFNIRYKVIDAELIESAQSLELFISVERSPAA